MSGRGGWPLDGRGGTLEYGPDGNTRPGPYYMLASSGPRVGEAAMDSLSNRAVHYAVIAYQRALNRWYPNADLKVDGIFGPRTRDLVLRWQKDRQDPTISVWGGIGPASSKALLIPMLVKEVTEELQLVICGLTHQESGWDAGAVGYVDDDDKGLCQINKATADAAGVSEEQCFQPKVAFNYAEQRLRESIDHFNDNLRDAIASYNLGWGGAARWIDQGRPDWYTPPGSSQPRNVKNYINTILTICQGG